MSRFLKPVDYSDDEDESRLVRARPIDLRFARKLGSYGAGKDFVVGSVKSQQELRATNVIVENDPNAIEIMDEKTKLERCNKLGAKILKAKLQGKLSLVEKLEKELYALREDGQGSSSTCKILHRTDGGDVRIPVAMSREGKDSRSRGRVDAIYHADKSIRDMVADEKETTSADHIFSAVRAAAKHRTDDDWVVDDAMMSVKRSRMKEEKETRRSRKNLIKGTLVFAS
uniref:Protein kinase domain-containing protein n=1 Tax=Elaeophora elaphi TaxID=1147741 RepID=A0A0R3RLC8_9BILA